MFYGIFSTNRLYHIIEVGNISNRAGGQHKYHAVKQTNTIISSLQPGLYGDDPLATVRLPKRGLSSQSLGKY